MIRAFDPADEIPDADICIIGGGPAGIALALALGARGPSVLLLEAGGLSPAQGGQTQRHGHKVTATHAAAELAMCRALGGTSHWWGGRCVPLDDIDFEGDTQECASQWPFPHSELSAFYDEAARFFGLPEAPFTAAPLGPAISPASFACLERWSPTPSLGAAHRKALETSSGILVLTGALVCDMEIDLLGQRLRSILLSGQNGTRQLQPRTIVLSCGGLETTRLLLMLQRKYPGMMGGENGALGRYYMGHLSGRIAQLVLKNPEHAHQFDFSCDRGAFARRRLTLDPEELKRRGLLNIAFWPDNPPFHAAAHGSGALSLVWLALAFPPIGRRLLSEAIRQNHIGLEQTNRVRHVINILGSPLRTARELSAILKARYLSRPRQPGFLLHNRSGIYDLHFHAEQAPNSRSRVELSDRQDVWGMPCLDVDLAFTKADAASVVEAHDVLKRALEGSGWADVRFSEVEGDRAACVLAQARDGFHQIGTTRMGVDPAKSVVDANCRVHGLQELYIASSSVFPTSGQANPTFATVALALRLARHLSEKARQPLAQFDSIGWRDGEMCRQVER